MYCYRRQKTRRLFQDLNCFFLDIWYEWRKKESIKDLWHEYVELDVTNNVQWLVFRDKFRLY